MQYNWAGDYESWLEVWQATLENKEKENNRKLTNSHTREKISSLIFCAKVFGDPHSERLGGWHNNRDRYAKKGEKGLIIIH